MAEFKLTIADPKTGKCYQKEVRDQEASGFIGLNIGESIKGDGFGFSGYEFSITGGSDFCGFPMRSGILGVRKQLTLYGGTGFSGKGRFNITRKGMKKRKTICGHKINAQISQINIKITKPGSSKIEEMFSKTDAKEGDASKETKEAPKKEAKPESKEEKPKEAPKAEAKEEAKPEAKKEEPKAEEKKKE